MQRVQLPNRNVGSVNTARDRVIQSAVLLSIERLRGKDYADKRQHDIIS